MASAALAPLGPEFTLLAGDWTPDDAVTLKSGKLVVAIETEDAATRTIDYAFEILSATGRPLTAPIRVASTDFGHASQDGLRVTETSDGGFTAQYSQIDFPSRTYQSLLQHYDATGQAVGSLVTLTQSQTPSGITPVAILGDGTLVQPISYLAGVHFPEDEVSRFQLYSPAGVALGPPSPLVAGYDEHVFALQSGGFATVLTDDGTREREVQVYDATGHALSSPVSIGNSYVSPDIIEEAQVSANRFVLVWDDDAVPTMGVHAQIFDLAGQKVGTELEVSPDQGRALSVSGLAGGGFVVAFDTPLDADEFGNDGSRFHVVEHAYDANGALIGSIIETGAADSAEHPVVTQTAGGFLLAWQDTATGTVEAQLFGSSGGTSQTGTAGDDMLTALAGGSTLRGLGGNDTLIGLGGADQLIGGAGDDTMRGGAGADSISGGQGDDGLHGGNGDDAFLGGQGDDRIDGGAGFDVAQWTGSRSDYRITMDGTGKLIVTDIGATGRANEGSDLASGIEQFRFADHVYSYAYVVAHLDTVSI